MADRPELYDGKAEKEEARKDKIWQVKMGYADESIFEKSLQMCHGGCGEYLTKEEEEILEIHCWDCKGKNGTGGGWSD